MIKLLAAALLGAAATPALAAAPSIAVTVADLDLSRPAGIATLDRRLTLAARQLCTSLEGRTVSDIQAARECRAEVLARVQPLRDARVAQARSSQLAQLAK